MKTDIYTTALGTEFKFGFECLNGHWRIHILDQPSYGDRDDHPHVVHVIDDGINRLVCWDGPLPTLEDAKIIAALWADFTQNYVLTGEHFPET